MAERTNKLILETEFRTTGNVEQSVSKIQSLQDAAKKAEGDTLKLVEAENKLRNAALEAGKAVETQTTKQSEFQRTITETGKAVNQVATNNKLKESFTGTSKQINDVNASLQNFEKSARAAKSVDQLTDSVKEFVDALPNDVRDEAVKTLDKEFDKLDKTINRPTARLRELKRLIATTDDPVLLRRYNEEAGELTGRLGNNNDLIRALASDTFFTDSLVESAQLAVGGFTAFQGALSLVTDDQEELARAAQKAQGALALLQGTQTILNDLKKQDNVLTRAQIIGQRLYAAAVGEATGAQKAFRLALIATGIGALIVGIGLLAANWDKVSAAVKGTTDEQRRFDELQSKINESISDERIELGFLIEELDKNTTSQKRRKEIIDQIQKDYPGYLKNVGLEGEAYDRTRQQLDKLARALEIKEQIEAAIELRRDKRREQLQAETKDLEEFQGTLGNFVTNFTNVFAQIALEEAGVFSATDEAKRNREEFITGLDEDIDFLSTKIEGFNAELTKLGDPTAGRDAAKKNVDKQLKAVEGSIEFFQQRVNKLTEKLNRDLVANSQEFIQTIPLLRQAQKELEAARKALGTPTDVEVFTRGSLNALQAQAALIQKEINNLPDSPQLQARAAELRKVNEEIKRIQDIINGPEQTKNNRNIKKELIEEERRFQLEILDITEAKEREKLELQIRFAKQRLNELLKEKGDEVEIQKAENLIDALELKLEQLGKVQKITTEQLIDGFSQVINAAAQATSQFLAIKQEENQRLIDIQQQRVTDAEEVAERGNAAVLNAERERLNDLNELNQRFARRQIEIATAQLIAESALAIAKAASQGGVLAPFTIASTLIALSAGLASARAQAQAVGAGASFRKGGYTGDGDPNMVSTALGNKGYEYHKAEYVMPAEVTAIGHNRKIFEDIRLKRIDLRDYFEKKQPTVIVNNDSKDVVKAIENIPGLSINLNKNGIISIVEKRNRTEKHRQFLKRK